MKYHIFLIVMFLLSIAANAQPDNLSKEVQSDESDSVSSDTTGLRKYAPKIYLDCDWCYQDYLKTEVSFVNFVRDRHDADIDLIVTTQSTGSDGIKYTLDFIGQKSYSGIRFDLEYNALSTYTDDERREGFLKVFEMGLIPFLSKTPLMQYIDINYKEKSSPEDVVDKWNYWVFKFSLGGNLYGQSSTENLGFWGNASASRTTLENKFEFKYWINYHENRFDYEDILTTSISRSQGINCRYIYSLSDHWSLGGWIGANTSTYSNVKLGLYIKLGLEYDIFPYAEYTKRSLTFAYTLAAHHFDYFERTIYDKTSEYLYAEGLSISLRMIRKWGSSKLYISGSNYLHDFSKNRLSIGGSVSINIIGGLDFNINSNYSFIHNQLSLPAGEASEEDIYLRRQQLQTSYSYSGYMGFSYTFGSIYTNIVNPRF